MNNSYQIKLTTDEKLAKLRELMKRNNLAAYYINTADPHQSEYIADHYKTRSWLTGFTGSAGYAVVTQKDALLWVDGRYFIQAEQQISGSEFKMMKMATAGFPTLEEWLLDNLDNGDCLGMNGNLISENFYKKLKNALADKNIHLQANHHLIEDLWTDRPPLPDAPIYIHELKYTGKTSAQKIQKIRKKMLADNVEAALYAGLNDIAWLFNFRGNDIKNTPVSMAFALVTKNKAILYIDQNKVSLEARRFLEENGITLQDYHLIYEDVQNPEISSIVLNQAIINHALFTLIPASVKIKNKLDYPYLMKAALNEVELKNQRNSYLRDSVALTRFIYFIKQNAQSGELNELNAAAKLHDLRAEQDLFIDESFSTIAAYGPNAAMMHYSATENNYSRIKPKSFLLIDSGGHYFDGTTDITRTISCGPLTGQEIEDYTLTLKAHINLARAKFLYGVTGYYLDVLARQPLWQNYMDYKSGTGHAVGYLLGVHEGPQRFNMNYVDIPLEHGMVITNEPGVYKENQYGIRIENDFVVLKDKQVDTDLFMKLDCLSFVPLDKDAIDVSLLEKYELAWLNNYQATVCRKISPYLNSAEQEWLKTETASL
ncbi:MAG: aminopeptidase P family protein [Saccharofermentanales bacterium]